jgi:bacteriorhodopsin
MVRLRLDQFYSSNVHAKEVPKTTRTVLKTALLVYFSIWCGYPTLWVLKEARVIDAVTSHCIHVVLDVLAKSGCDWNAITHVCAACSSRMRMQSLRPWSPTRAYMQMHI